MSRPLQDRHEHQFTDAKREASKAAIASGGSCSKCKLFQYPRHGTLGYCNDRENYRNTYNVCENYQAR
jgi:hypothetical protein